MIYKIAICDDDDYFCGELRGYVEEFMAEKKVQYEIGIFYDGTELREELAHKDFDLLFLDVEMPGLMGTDTAELIRKKDLKVPIIFVTSYDTFTKQAYDLEVIGYVTKPVDKAKLFRWCDIAFEYMKKLGKESLDDVLKIKQQQETFTIVCSRILYIEKCGNQSLVHTTDGKKYNTYLTLKEVTRELDDDTFYRMDRGVIVNWNYVTDIQRYYAVLRSGGQKVEIPFSRRRYTSIRNLFFEKLNDRWNRR